MNLRYLWRSLSLAFVLLFALFPTLCYASETVTTNSAITWDLRNQYDVMPLDYTEESPANGQITSYHWLNFQDVLYNNYIGSIASVGNNYTGTLQYSKLKGDMYNCSGLEILHRFHMSDSTKFVEKGSSFDFQITGLYYEYQEYISMTNEMVRNSAVYSPSSYDVIRVSLTDKNFTDEVVYTCSSSDLDIVGDTLTVNATFTDVPFDVYGITLFFYTDTNLDSELRYFNAPLYYRFFVGYENSTFSIIPEDENTGLLKGIIAWLTAIRDGIVNVGNGVTKVFNSIVELPNKIWSVMENGIKGLLVPSESDITAMKDKWDTLLSDRFGVVYESGALLIDIANSVQESSTTETITFPSVSYNFSGTDFTFGGYQVDIIPDGFEFLADILKGVIDIVCTLAFLNAMRRKYDELMMR